MISAPMTPPVRTLAELGPIVPELFVVLGAFALLMLDLFIDPRRRIITHVLAVAVLLGAAVMIAMGVGGQGSTLADMFVRDAGADVLKVTGLIVAAIALGYAWAYLRERDLYQGEIPVLFLFTAAGMMLLVSSPSGAGTTTVASAVLTLGRSPRSAA